MELIRYGNETNRGTCIKMSLIINVLEQYCVCNMILLHSYVQYVHVTLHRNKFLCNKTN